METVIFTNIGQAPYEMSCDWCERLEMNVKVPIMTVLERIKQLIWNASNEASSLLTSNTTTHIIGSIANSFIPILIH